MSGNWSADTSEFKEAVNAMKSEIANCNRDNINPQR